MGENGNGTENDTLQSILTENKILKGKLRGFKTLDKMFKDVKERNVVLEDEISQLKEKKIVKIPPPEYKEEDYGTFEYIPKANELKEVVPHGTEYKLPTPKMSMLENMSIANELRSIFEHRDVAFEDPTKLGEELKKLADSISVIEEKRRRDQEVLKVLTKELKKCRSENEIFRRENENFQKQFLPNQAGAAEKEKYVFVETDPLGNTSDEWKNMYFTTKKKSDQDLTDLRKHLEAKCRQNSQLEAQLANEKKQHNSEIAELIKELSTKLEHGKAEEEDDMISQQMQIFQDDFKVEHEERMKAQAAKLEMEKKFDALQKEFQEKTNTIANNERKLKYYMEKCDILTKEKMLIKNELDLAQQNLKRASEFISNLSVPQKKTSEAEKHMKRLERISALTPNTTNDNDDTMSDISNWKCPSCTLENKPWAYNCAICKGRKPG
ncbi:protein BCAP [Octopus vulgaris]|uniref:Protein BCAP n=1 Tax=Octopus vulgaris TaxID=6645 RepID=A0AA36B1C7_OCTVU|nr:protein BCAP [Octopus vulgaris]CAI9726154.1 protein BCAP [Octopus vulgaris]